MQSPSLPTNPDDWPRDPWQLLGVPREADREQIRRAYARMLRQYKPEHHPAAFQKIRAAYEMALQFAGHVQSVDEGKNDDAEFVATPIASDQTEPEALDHDLLAATEQARQAIDAERDALWKQAVAGDGLAASAGLAALHQKHPRDEEIALRLYWVRRLFPDSDTPSAAQTLATFLASGTPGAYRAATLYRRELTTSTDEALSNHCRATIAMNLAAALQRGIIASRWQAATATGRLSTIGRDLSAWRKIVSLDDDTWPAILFLALGHLRWGTHPKCEAYFERVRHEIYRLTNEDLQYADALDELDFMESVWHGWNGLRHEKTVAKHWAPLIVASFCGSSDLLRRTISSFLCGAGRKPVPTLMRVDKLAGMSSAAVVQLQRGLDRFRYEHAAELEIPYEWNHQPTKQLALDFLHANHRSTYRQIRRALLEFCAEFTTPPSLFGCLAMEAWPKDPAGAAVLGSAIKIDAPLHVVWLAHRLYWH